ncbi:uracil-DNA glycosylase family protein [Treponema sp. C6A8]|uniref:uracil-DNA glycosylase family protein n=1 Tax=Treponema sp. C6A8 TaxID=1410609 RepID=UPI003526DB9D
MPSTPVIHTIPPVYNSESRILILGTMPSPKSREAGFFYMHAQNRFWKILPASVSQAPVLQTPSGP